MTTTSLDRTGPAEVLAQAADLVAAGRSRDAVALLHQANRRTPDPELETQLVAARNAAARERLAAAPTSPSGATETDARVAPEPTEGSPVIAPGDLAPGPVRHAIETHGHVVVPGLFSPDLVAWFVDGIEQALATREAGPQSEVARGTSWYRTLKLPKEEAGWLGRHWVGASGGVLGIDSPALIGRLLDVYEGLGLKALIAEVLGEEPLLGGNKCTMRKVAVDANTEWHQDGAFLGSGIRAVNVWVALTDCGVDAPGLDLVPTRIDRVLETGTGGAIFDWSVGPETVATVAGPVGVTRPEIRAGDALLFDEVFLHRTAISEAMVRPRHAIESWFFGPSRYPSQQVAIDW